MKVLSRVFRGKFLERLKQAHADGTLSFQGSLDAPARRGGLRRASPNRSMRRTGSCTPSRPSAALSQVLKYLARYTHRVAISNHRLLAMEDGRVTFSYKDYAHGERPAHP